MTECTCAVLLPAPALPNALLPSVYLTSRYCFLPIRRAAWHTCTGTIHHEGRDGGECILFRMSSRMLQERDYGVATSSRLLNIISLFCRIWSLV